MDRESQANITLLLKETEQSSYFQKYRRWKDLLSKTSSEDYLLILNKFLDYFPFNYDQWIQYIQLTGPQSYRKALKCNPKSYQLWNKYLEYIKCKEDSSQLYKKQLQNALTEVGADVRAVWMYTDYYALLDSKYHYNFYKNIFNRSLINLEQVYTQFQSWIDGLEQKQIQIIVAKETKGKPLINIEPKDFIKEDITRMFKKAIKNRQNRIDLESKIKNFYFNGNEAQLEEDSVIWRELIDLERTNGVVENTSYCYERMLMAQTHSIQLWEEVFHYLQNQTNKYLKVLNIFRQNNTFFTNFNVDLYLYWCDLEERQDPSKARGMYTDLQTHNRKLQIFLRHIQFQIRQKQWDNAKNLFDTLVVENQGDHDKIEVLSYILVEYANYVVKYYKDYDYPRKLLKNYFEYLPYNDYLFTSYLQFMRNYQNKQGYYDDLMEVIVTGLKKGKKNLHEGQFGRVVKMVKHYLRSTLSSIYLIKMSERRMMEFDEKVNHGPS